MIELVVFDMAGTTVHDGDAVNLAFREALSTAGLSVDPSEVNGVMGLAKPEAIRRLLGSSATDPRIEAIHAEFVSRMQRYYATHPAVREVDGASRVFSELRREGVKVALNTGFSRGIVEAIFQRLGWDVPGTMDGWISSDEVPRGRPAPDMIRELQRRLGVSVTRRIAKVGDTPADLEEGYFSGCGLNIGVTTGAFSRRDLERFPHTHIVESIVEVPALILTAGISGD
ncbi:MAG: HAD hydrolase-like protein [Gemmataceae bacterium]|nr:HAD hydrolase-like protein [Gemmataceae bacterium]